MNITSSQTVTFVFTEANRKLAAKLKKHILETKKNYDFGCILKFRNTVLF